jgi:hypothetical protein
VGFYGDVVDQDDPRFQKTFETHGLRGSDMGAAGGAVFLPLSFCIVCEPLYTLYMHLTSHQPFFYCQRTSNPYIPTVIFVLLV